MLRSCALYLQHWDRTAKEGNNCDKEIDQLLLSPRQYHRNRWLHCCSCTALGSFAMFAPVAKMVQISACWCALRANETLYELQYPQNQLQDHGDHTPTVTFITQDHGMVPFKCYERFVRQNRHEPPPEFPLTLRCSSSMHYLLSPNKCALTQNTCMGTVGYTCTC